MADFLKILDGAELANISVQFDYASATADFVGLKLMPMVKTPNLKVAMYNLVKGHAVPAIALVHAFDAEARIGDRPSYEEIREDMFLIKEKIDQGEELRKKVRDLGMDSGEDAMLAAIYDDIANEIAKVLTAFERRACELLSTGKIVINENGAVRNVDYHFADANTINVTGWSTPSHDIIGDYAALKTASKGRIVRQIMSTKVLGYIMANERMNAFATASLQPMTEQFAKNYFLNNFGIEIIVDDRTYRTSYQGGKEYRFFDEDTIVSLTTRGEVGKTFMTTTPTEDAGIADKEYGFVAVNQWTTPDPCTSWTKAEGVGLPVIADINNTLFLTKVTA